MKPIFIVSSSGRSGTTLLAEKLSKSNRIICDKQYPYENFIANYYIKLSSIISLNGKFDIYPKYGSPNFLIGPYPDNLKYGNKKYLYHKLTTDFKYYIKKLIGDYYNNYALLEGNLEVNYFVEKFGHFLLDEAKKIYNNELKILTMIRNPLDIYDSIKKFNLKRGFKSFGMENFKTERDYLIKSFLPQQISFYNNEKLFNENTYIVEYNNLINSTLNELEKIFDYLDLSYDKKLFISNENQNDLHKTRNMKSLVTKEEKEIITMEINNNSLLKKFYGK